jgi:hypothetical protein
MDYHGKHPELWKLMRDQCRAKALDKDFKKSNPKLYKFRAAYLLKEDWHHNHIIDCMEMGIRAKKYLRINLKKEIDALNDKFRSEEDEALDKIMIEAALEQQMMILPPSSTQANGRKRKR